MDYNPYILFFNFTVPKPGTCPDPPPGMMGHCAEMCIDDHTCKGDAKSAKNPKYR